MDVNTFLDNEFTSLIWYLYFCAANLSIGLYSEIGTSTYRMMQ